MTGYRNLEVWKRSKTLAVLVYRLTQEDLIARDFGMVDQVRRSSVSIASNIAEGDERDSIKESIRFFYISKGSVAELITQLEIISEAYPELSSSCEPLLEEAESISRMLRGLIKARS